MAETPVNLNRVRKQRARDTRRKEAEANAVNFGRTRSEKAHDRQEAERLARHLDDHRREGDPQ